MLPMEGYVWSRSDLSKSWRHLFTVRLKERINLALSKVLHPPSLWRGRCPRCRWRGYSSRCPPSASGSPAPRWSPSRTLSSYIWVHDRAVQAADDRLPEVGGPGDEEGHGEQEEGGGGVQLQHQVLRRQRGGGEASQVAKHLIYTIFPKTPLNNSFHHLENHIKAANLSLVFRKTFNTHRILWSQHALSMWSLEADRQFCGYW